MKPLASPSEEYRLEGTIALGWSLLLGAIVAAIAAHPLRLVSSFVIGGAIFGAIMYVVLFHRYLRAALKQAGEISNPNRETRSETRRRVATRSGFINLGAVFILLLLARGRTGGALLGFVAGNGVTFLVLARQVRRWEATHGVEILREPRWRGRWNEGRFGRGVMDPQDFYYVRMDAGWQEIQGTEGSQSSAASAAR
jgi:hypothetical protein